MDEVSEVKHVPGIVYFSTIPKGINVVLISDIIGNFGEIGRVYLVPKQKMVGRYRQYEEGWVEFLNMKKAKRAAKLLNCSEVAGSKRNPWYGELWNVKFLPDTSWNDLFGAEREEEELRRTAHDRDITLAKRESHQFEAALKSHKLEKRMKILKGKRFNERKSLNFNKKQKLTEEELNEKLSRSCRTPPEGLAGLAAVKNSEFMKNLFAGGF